MTGVFSSLSLAAAYRSILRADGGARIFQEFGFVPGKRYISPFRPDATKKNFSVFTSPKGEVCFKDFVSGDGGTFTALLYGFGYTTFEAQIRFAAQIYGIEVNSHSPLVIEHSPNSNTKTPNTPKQKPLNTQHSTLNTSPKFYRVTQLELADCSPVELQRLGEISAGLITRDLVERFGIRALRSYTDEGRIDKGFSYGGSHEARYTLVVPSANGNYYAYCYYQSEQHSPFPNRAKNFHLKLADYTDEVKFALGLSELRPNEPAYLVEGIKDCLILLAKGYNAFTLGGVQHRLHPSIIRRLQENNNTLVILFDTDFAGIDAAQRLSISLNTQHSSFNTQHCICTLPRLERQETKDAPKPQKNDIADYVTAFGFDALLEETLLAPAPLLASSLTKGTITIPAWKLSIEGKLGDDASALKTLWQLTQQSSRLVLRAPTGCGKTHTLLRTIAPKHFAETGGMTVFAVPTLALAEQIREEYADMKPIIVTGNDNDLHRYYQQFGENAKPLDTCIIIAVYDSVRRCADILLEKNTLFCIDEMHTLVHDYHYRTHAMRSMNNALNHAAKVVCLSATPELLFHEAPFHFTYCDINVKEQRPLSYSLHDYTKRDEAVLALLLHTLETINPHDRILLRVQSKSLLKRMEKLLVKHGVQENEIAILTNDTSPTSEEYRLLMQTRHFSRKIILATSILDTGVNILNSGQIHVIMADEKNEDTIVQVANRFRRAEHVHVHLLYSDRVGKEQKRAFSEQYHFFHTLTSAQMLAETMNDQAGTTSTTHGVSRKSASRLFDTMLHFDGKRRRWLQDELSVMHACAQVRVQTASRAELHDALAKYGFVQRHTTTQELLSPITHTLSPITVQSIETVAQAQRDEQRRNEETVLSLLKENLPYFLAALNTVSRSRSFKDKLPTVCPEALLSFTKNHAETAVILTEHAALLSEARTETLVRYYTEARTLGFDHLEALHLVRTNSDPRKWQSFTERLAMKQREAINLTGLTDNVLSQHDREKLRREEEQRRFILSSAEHGCFFRGSDGQERHIPNSIRSKKELAERLNAYQTRMFRISQQKAGEIVEAMFHVKYVRERIQTESGVRLSGYYLFEQENTLLKRKTLADYLRDYGVDGERYEVAFLTRLREEAARYVAAERRIIEEQEEEYAVV